MTKDEFIQEIDRLHAIYGQFVMGKCDETHPEMQHFIFASNLILTGVSAQMRYSEGDTINIPDFIDGHERIRYSMEEDKMLRKNMAGKSTMEKSDMIANVASDALTRLADYIDGR
jgi:hypothetical protein